MLEIRQEAVRRECIDLHRFLEPMVKMCADIREDYPVFSAPSIRFFSYIGILGRKTQKFLVDFPAYYARSKDPRGEASKRLKLVTLRNGWELLHEYLRPALDADSLHLPTPLIAAFEDIVAETQEWSHFEFVLFHTNQANYLQVPAGMARRVANDIAEGVGAERFPDNLGLVGIPYSQASSFLLNCLLPHEFAHFIFQEDLGDEVETQIENSLEALVQTVEGITNQDVISYLDALKDWVEETFCDLLAVCLIGPAFSLAFTQLIAATVMIGRPDGEPDDFFMFKYEYPAHCARFHFQQELLKKLGWWDAISGWGSPSFEVLKSCEIWSPSYRVEGFSPGVISDEQLLGCYRGVCAWVVDDLARRFEHTSDRVDLFSVQAAEISKYLSEAIVPSTIIVEGKQVYPDPVVLINAGFHFYLERLEGLIERIDDIECGSVETSSRISARLELWILKALEDQRLLARQEK